MNIKYQAASYRMLCSNKFGFYQIPFVLCTVVVAVLDIPGHGGHLTKKKQKERKIKLRAKYPIEIISMQLFNPRKKSSNFKYVYGISEHSPHAHLT